MKKSLRFPNIARSVIFSLLAEVKASSTNRIDGDSVVWWISCGCCPLTNVTTIPELSLPLPSWHILVILYYLTGLNPLCCGRTLEFSQASLKWWSVSVLLSHAVLPSVSTIFNLCRWPSSAAVRINHLKREFPRSIWPLSFSLHVSLSKMCKSLEMRWRGVRFSQVAMQCATPSARHLLTQACPNAFLMHAMTL